jgi:hypothetical protein
VNLVLTPFGVVDAVSGSLAATVRFPKSQAFTQLRMVIRYSGSAFQSLSWDSNTGVFVAVKLKGLGNE